MRAVARNRLIESRLTPNAISLTGLVGNLIAAALIIEHHFVLAGIAFVLGSVCDMFDGRYSRMSGKGTPFGAFLDSTLDRIEEGVVLAAVAWWFAEQGDEVAVGATVLTVVGSYMVSYTRARAEALGVECKVGIASRAVRVVILSAGLLFADGEIVPDFDLLEPAIYAMAALTIFTTFQRVFHVRGQLAAAGVTERPGGFFYGSAGLLPPGGRFHEAGGLSVTETSIYTNGGPRYQSEKVRVAIVGVGNCASSFVQGVRVLQGRRSEPGRTRPDARGPRRLPRPRHRVHGGLRHRRRQGRQGPVRGDLGRARTTRSSSPTCRTSTCPSTAA